jgi:general secretion pathway protein G
MMRLPVPGQCPGRANAASRFPLPACRSAFTLVELLAVLAIIGILLGLAFGIGAYASRSARRSKAFSQIERLANAVQAALVEDGALPLSLLEITNRLPSGFTYESSTGLPLDPWGNPYEYVHQTNSPYSYFLFSYGPDGVDSNPANDIVLGR